MGTPETLHGHHHAAAKLTVGLVESLSSYCPSGAFGRGVCTERDGTAGRIRRPVVFIIVGEADGT